MSAREYTESRRLYERAGRIIPGAHHLSGKPLTDPRSSPMYLERALGSRVWDVDGHSYVDYLMAFGAFLLGYAHPEVDAAGFEQAQRGRLMSMNHPLHVRFIETLLERFPGYDMGVFMRTGSEATTGALRIARRATGRRRVVRCGYHGWHDWCLPLEPYVPGGLDQQVLEFSANDPATLEAIFDAHDDIAAVILAPEMVVPHVPATFHRIAAITRGHGAALIMDEVKTGVRIAPGTIAARIGLRPDLLTLSKALGNGWAVAVILGQRSVMEHAAGMHLSATFHGDTAGMAAALKVLEVVEQSGAREHAWHLGERFIAGMNELCSRYGMPAVAFAEPLPPMPMFRFTHADAEVNLGLTKTFTESLLARGTLLHPRHMGFISLAHSHEDIDTTLDAASQAMQETAARFADCIG